MSQLGGLAVCHPGWWHNESTGRSSKCLTSRLTIPTETDESGGDLFMSQSSEVTIDNCTFSNYFFYINNLFSEYGFLVEVYNNFGGEASIFYTFVKYCDYSY